MRSVGLVSVISLAALVAVLLATRGGARAGDAPAGNAAAGKATSLACQACHGPSPDAPHLVGQREGYIAKQLAAFKRGDRKHDSMTAIANQLSDADIANLAAYWSSQPPGSDTTLAPEAAAIRKSPMPFPRDFPANYVLYETSNEKDGPNVKKMYVNKIALQAAKANKTMPDGSAIIHEVYTVKLGADGKPAADKDGKWLPEKLVAYVGMESRAGWGNPIPPLLRNANWAYNLFTPDKVARAELNQANCLICHKPKSATSFVFGVDIIKKANAR